MATATEEPKTKAGQFELDIDCEFNGVSIGEHTARLGVKVSRDDLSLDDADQFFAGKILQGVISLESRADEKQKKLSGMEDEGAPEIVSVFTVKQFSCKPKEFILGLTFELTAIHVEDLAAFVKRSGILKADCIGILEEGNDDDGGSSSSGGSRSLTSNGRGFPQMEVEEQIDALMRESDLLADEDLSALTTGRMKKMLGDSYKDGLGLTAKKVEKIKAACGGQTIEKFERWMSQNEYWHRDIDGFGEEWITRLQDAHLALRLKYPQPDDREVIAEERLALYKDGCEAAMENQGRDTNPHKDGTVSHGIWDAGWVATDGKRDAEDLTIFDGDDEDQEDGNE